MRDDLGSSSENYKRLDQRWVSTNPAPRIEKERGVVPARTAPIRLLSLWLGGRPAQMLEANPSGMA